MALAEARFPISVTLRWNYKGDSISVILRLYDEDL